MFTSAVLRGGDQDGIATRYGLGNAMTDVAGRPAHEQGGGIHGFTCDLLRVPGDDLLVVILSNNPMQDVHDLAHRVAESVLGVPQKAKPAAMKLTADELEAHTGVYLVPERSGVRRIVSRDGETLRLQRTGGDLRSSPSGQTPSRPRTAPLRFERGTGRRCRRPRRQGIGPVFRSLRTDEAAPPPLKEVATTRAPSTRSSASALPPLRHRSDPAAITSSSHRAGGLESPQSPVRFSSLVDADRLRSRAAAPSRLFFIRAASTCRHRANREPARAVKSMTVFLLGRVAAARRAALLLPAKTSRAAVPSTRLDAAMPEWPAEFPDASGPPRS
jgi:hypothetical protein